MFRTRASISGLMGIVLAAALGITALGSRSPEWSSATYLFTCGVLALAVVGAACGPPEGRSWWIGFAVFGGGYLAMTHWRWEGGDVIPRVPTIDLLRNVMARLGLKVPMQNNGIFSNHFEPEEGFLVVGHCLWTLGFAILGGTLARVVFAVPLLPQVPREEDTARADPASPGWRRTKAAGAILAIVGYLAAALIGSRTDPGLWAGMTELLTRGLLGLAVVGAAFRRGRSRARWLGAALFGVGYLMLIPAQDEDPNWPQYATHLFLSQLEPWLPPMVPVYPAASESTAEVNTRIARTLDRRIPMRFPRETPLEDVLAYVVAATREPDGRRLPIYVDPIGLQEAEKTMQSPVMLDLDGVPLKTTLRLVLRELGMLYLVRDGLLEITQMESGVYEDDLPYTQPFFVIGQCVLTWVAAGVGSVLAPLAAGTRRE